LGKHKRTVHQEQDPEIREVKWILGIVCIIWIGWLIIFPALSEPAEPLRFIEGIIPLAYAEENRIVMLGDSNSPSHTGTGVACPTITGPTSATDAGGNTIVHNRDSSANGCRMITWTLDRSTTNQNLLPKFFDDFVTGLSFVWSQTTQSFFSVDCRLYEVSEQGVDPRLNITGAYEALKLRTQNIVGGLGQCDNGVSRSEFRTSGTANYFDSIALNDTFFSFGINTVSDQRAVAQDKTVSGNAYTKFTFTNPTPLNNTVWMLQEHPKFPASTIDGGFFGIDDTTFTMDSNTVDVTDTGQVVVFREFDKSNLGGWDLSSKSYRSGDNTGTPPNRLNSFSNEDTSPRDIFIKPDGLTVFMLGGTGLDVNEYRMNNPATPVGSQAWNSTSCFKDGALVDVTSNAINTCRPSSNGNDIFSVSTNSISPQGLFFKPDGLKMFIADGSGSADIDEYTLTTGFDLSTASYSQSGSLTQFGQLKGLFITKDGTKLFTADGNSANITRYDFGTPWDISTISFNQFVNTPVFSVDDGVTSAQDVFFRPDGGRMFIMDNDANGLVNNLETYDLSTPFDLTTSVWAENEDMSHGGSNTFEGIFFKDFDGQTVYLVTSDGERIYEWGLTGSAGRVKVTGGIVSQTSATDQWLRVEVKDGSYGTGTLDSFPENEYDIYQGGGSLGVIHIEPTLTITTGSTIANITSVEWVNTIKYDFEDINLLKFYETSPVETFSSTLFDDIRPTLNDYDMGILNITSVATTGVAGATLPSPNPVTNLVASLKDYDTIKLTWDHDFLNSTGVRIERNNGTGYITIATFDDPLHDQFIDANQENMTRANIEGLRDAAGLEENVSYTYRVIVLNGLSESPITTSNTQLTPDNLPFWDLIEHATSISTTPNVNFATTGGDTNNWLEMIDLDAVASGDRSAVIMKSFNKTELGIGNFTDFQTFFDTQCNTGGATSDCPNALRIIVDDGKFNRYSSIMFPTNSDIFAFDASIFITDWGGGGTAHHQGGGTTFDPNLVRVSPDMDDPIANDDFVTVIFSIDLGDPDAGQVDIKNFTVTNSTTWDFTNSILNYTSILGNCNIPTPDNNLQNSIDVCDKGTIFATTSANVELIDQTYNATTDWQYREKKDNVNPQGFSRWQISQNSTGVVATTDDSATPNLPREVGDFIFFKTFTPTSVETILNVTITGQPNPDGQVSMTLAAWNGILGDIDETGRWDNGDFETNTDIFVKQPLIASGAGCSTSGPQTCSIINGGIAVDTTSFVGIPISVGVYSQDQFGFRNAIFVIHNFTVANTIYNFSNAVLKEEVSGTTADRGLVSASDIIILAPPPAPTGVNATATGADVLVEWNSVIANPSVDTYFINRTNATIAVDNFESYSVGDDLNGTSYDVIRDITTGAGAGTPSCTVPGCDPEVFEVVNVNPISGSQSYRLNFTELRTGTENVKSYMNIIKKDIPTEVDSFSFKLRSDDLFGEGGGAETVGGMSFYVIEWVFANGTTTSETGANDSFGRRIQQFRGCGVGTVPTQDWTTNGNQYCHGETADFLAPMSINYGDTIDVVKLKSCPFSCNDLPAPNTLGTVKTVSRNATALGISILGASEFANVVSWKLYIGGVASTSQSTGGFPDIKNSYGFDIYIDDISFTDSGVPVDFLGDDFETVGSVPSNLFSFTDSSVEKATQYAYRVFGENSLGNGTFGTSNLVTTNDNPAQVQGLNAQRPIATQIDLDWTALPDDSGLGDPATNLNLTKYQIFRNENNAGFTLLAENLAQSPPSIIFNDTTTNALFFYSYQISACNIVGCGTNSSSFFIAEGPPRPENLTATADIADVELDWDASTNQTLIDDFRIERSLVGPLSIESLVFNANFDGPPATTYNNVDSFRWGNDNRTKLPLAKPCNLDPNSCIGDDFPLSPTLLGNGVIQMNSGFSGAGINTGDSARAGSGGERQIIDGNRTDWDFLSNGDWTWNAWIHPDVNGEKTLYVLSTIDERAAGFGDRPNLNGTKILIDGGDTNSERFAVQVYDNANDGNFALNETSPNEMYDDDATFHMYSIIHKNGQFIKWYRDGVLLETDVTPLINSRAGAPSIMMAGGYCSSTDGCRSISNVTITGVDTGGLRGNTIQTWFDEWSIWDIALDSSDITTLYGAGDGFNFTGQDIPGDDGSQSFEIIVPSLIAEPNAVFFEDFSSYPDNATANLTWPPNLCQSGTGGADNFCGVNATSDTIVTKWSNSGSATISYDLFTNLGINATDSNGIGDFSITWNHLEDDLGSASGNNYAMSVSNLIGIRTVTQDAVCMRFIGSQAPQDTQVVLSLADNEPCTALDDIDSNVEDGDADLNQRRYFNITKSGDNFTSETFFCEEMTVACRISSMSASAGGELYRDLRFVTIAGIGSGSSSIDYKFDYDDITISLKNGTLLTSYRDRDVELGTEYTYRVTALNNTLPSEPSVSATVTTNNIPDQVVGTSVSFDTPTKIDVQWTDLAFNSGIGSPSTGLNLTKYQVFRQNLTGGEPFVLATEIFATSPPVNFFNDTAVQFPNIFSYQISGCNAINCGPNSTATLSAVTVVPDAPQNVVAIAVNPTVELDWDDANFALNYTVQRRNDTASESGFTTIATGVIGSEFIDTGVSQDHDFTYLIYSINDIGNATATLPEGQPSLDDLVAYYQMNTDDIVSSPVNAFAVPVIKNLGTLGNTVDMIFTCTISGCVSSPGADYDSQVDSGDDQDALVPGLIGQAGHNNGTSSITGTRWILGNSSTPSGFEFLRDNSLSNKSSINFWIKDPNSAGLGATDTVTPLFGNNKFGPFNVVAGFRLFVDGFPDSFRIFSDGVSGGINWNVGANDDWHMITIRIDHANATVSGNAASVCIDEPAGGPCRNIPGTGGGQGYVAPNAVESFDISELQFGRDGCSGGSCKGRTFQHDEVAIWDNTVLSGAELDYLYNSGAGRELIFDQTGLSLSNQVNTNTVPTEPLNLTGAMGLVIPDLEDVFLDWDEELDNGTGSPSTGVPIINYSIDRKQGLGSFSFLANVSGGIFAFEDETVISGANYTYKVRGANVIGFSPFSNTFSIITTPLMPPEAPTNLTATTLSGSQIKLDWLSAVSGDAPTEYVLQERHVGFTGFSTIATIPAPTLTFTASGLISGDTYDYQVRADNGAGASPYSNIAQNTTFTVPSAPLNLIANTLNETAIFVEWEEPTFTNGQLQNYTLDIESPVSGGFSFLSTINGNVTNFTATSLTTKTEYNFRVNATNLVGTGPYSNQAANTTFGVPDAPINLGFVTNGISEITVDWDEGASNFGSSVTGYRIDQATNVGGTFVTAIANTGNNIEPLEELFDGLLQETFYIFRIAAINGFGLSPFSANLTASTFIGPSAPENFFAAFNATRPYSVNLTWEVPLNDGGRPITNYIIERKDTLGVFQQIGNVSSVTFAFTDGPLLNLSTHEYRVAAQTNPVGSFTSGQQVTTFVAPNFINFTITDSQLVEDILKQNYTFIINDCFPDCTLSQADLIRNGVLDASTSQSESIVLDATTSFSTYYIVPVGVVSSINTTAFVTNLGGSGNDNVGIIFANPAIVTPSLFFTQERTVDFENVNFTLTRKPILWDANCVTRENSFEVKQTVSLQQVGFFQGLLTATPSLNLYVACFDPPNQQILSFTSFGTGNGTLALTSFTSQLGDFLGVPVPFIFIIFLAAIWTGRSAPTGIIFLAVAIGTMGVLGYFPTDITGDPLITGTFWSLIVILTTLGVLVGKRFF